MKLGSSRRGGERGRAAASPARPQGIPRATQGQGCTVTRRSESQGDQIELQQGAAPCNLPPASHPSPGAALHPSSSSSCRQQKQPQGGGTPTLSSLGCSGYPLGTHVAFQASLNPISPSTRASPGSKYLGQTSPLVNIQRWVPSGAPWFLSHGAGDRQSLIYLPCAIYCRLFMCMDHIPSHLSHL